MSVFNQMYKPTKEYISEVLKPQTFLCVLPKPPHTSLIFFCLIKKNTQSFMGLFAASEPTVTTQLLTFLHTSCSSFPACYQGTDVF